LDRRSEVSAAAVVGTYLFIRMCQGRAGALADVVE